MNVGMQPWGLGDSLWERLWRRWVGWQARRARKRLYPQYADVQSGSKRYPLGFFPQKVSDREIHFIAYSQIPVQPQKLILQSPHLEKLVVLDILVGKNSMLLSSAPVSAVCFAPTTPGNDIQFDVAQISQHISLRIGIDDAYPKLTLDDVLPLRANLLGKGFE